MSPSSTSSSNTVLECPEAPATECPMPRRTEALGVGRTDAVALAESASSRRVATLSLRGFRPWGAVFAVALLIGAEGAARRLLPDVPAEGIYGSFPVQQKVTGINETLRAGPIDVLFIGSSLVDHGIDPLHFDRVCGEHDVEVTAYNLGVRGPSLSGIQAILNRFLLPRVKAKLVYICLSPNALNHSRTAYVSDINRRFEEMAQMPRLEEFVRLGLSRLHLYAYRQDMCLWLRNGGHGGFSGRGADRRRGFTPRHGLLDGEDDWSGRVGDFVPDRRDVEALAALCRWCTSRGTDYVIVDMPLSQHCRDLPTRDQRTAYEAILRQAAMPGTAVLSFPPDEFGARCFNDGLHLNAEGATHLTTLLARDAVTRRLARSP